MLELGSQMCVWWGNSWVTKLKMPKTRCICNTRLLLFLKEQSFKPPNGPIIWNVLYITVGCGQCKVVEHMILHFSNQKLQELNNEAIERQPEQVQLTVGSASASSTVQDYKLGSRWRHNSIIQESDTKLWHSLPQSWYYLSQHCAPIDACEQHRQALLAQNFESTRGKLPEQSLAELSIHPPRRGSYI